MAKQVVPLRPAPILIEEEHDEVARWIAENQGRSIAEVLREAIMLGLPLVGGYSKAQALWQDGERAPRPERLGGVRPKPTSRRSRERAREAASRGAQ